MMMPSTISNDFVDAASRIKVGYGLDESIQMGPMQSIDGKQRVAGYIEKGIEDKNRRARDLRYFIEKQLAEAEEKLRISEEELRKYTEKHKTSGMGDYIMNRIFHLENQYNDLLKNYTKYHPEAAKVRNQIDYLEKNELNILEVLDISEFEKAHRAILISKP